MPDFKDMMDDVDDAIDDAGEIVDQDRSITDHARDAYDKVQDTRDKIQNARDRFGKLRDKVNKGKEGAEEAGKKGAKELGKEGAKEAGKKGAKELGKEGAKEAGKEIAKQAGKELAKEGVKEGVGAVAEASNAAAPGVGTAVHLGIEALDAGAKVSDKVGDAAFGVEPTKIMTKGLPYLLGACILAPLLLIMGASLWPAFGAEKTPGTSTSGNAIVDAALKWTQPPDGPIPYSWGGGGLDGPTFGTCTGYHGSISPCPADTTKGFDCSGLTRYAVYNGTGRGVELPRTADDQCNSSLVTKISDKSQLQPGDLVCFYSASKGRVTHIAVYKGPGEIVEAPATGQDVKVSNRTDYDWGVRVNP